MKRKLPLSFFVFTFLGLSAVAADYRMQTLETAQTAFAAATNSAMYAEAARQFDVLVAEEGLRNGALFYTIGNSWFMAGDLGRAILNYRRAERFIPGDPDLQHNLAAARALRVDLIPARPRHPLAAKWLGWHYGTSARLRWWLFAGCWTVGWGAWIGLRRVAKKEGRIVAAVAGTVAVPLLVSLGTEAIAGLGAQPGVVLAAEVQARKGDGDRYALAFLEPLHAGTEMELIERRGDWWQIRLADGQQGWIPAAAAETVRID